MGGRIGDGFTGSCQACRVYEADYTVKQDSLMFSLCRVCVPRLRAQLKGVATMIQTAAWQRNRDSRKGVTEDLAAAEERLRNVEEIVLRVWEVHGGGENFPDALAKALLEEK